MSTLDRVIILNLERRIDRFHFILGAMNMLEFPGVWEAVAGDYNRLIMRYIAHDYRDYNSPDEIVEAASSDGFPELAHYIDHLETVERRIGGREKIGLLGRFSTLWSQMSLFRYIVENKLNAIYLLDNHSFNYRYPYERVLKTLRSCVSHGVAMILQIGCSKRFSPIYNSGVFFGKGLLNGWDQAFYLTPEGAEFLLHLALKVCPHKGDMMDRLRNSDENGLDFAKCSHLLEPMINKSWVFDSDREEEYDENINYRK